MPLARSITPSLRSLFAFTRGITPSRSFHSAHCIMSKHPPFKQVEATREPFDKNIKYQVTKTVDPEWVPGSSVNASPHPSASSFVSDPKKFTFIDPSSIEPPHNYKLLINGVIPRPIAFVSSADKNGVRNLAPFSYFNIVTHQPPISRLNGLLALQISVAINRKSADSDKDTAANIRATKRFTVNIISEPFLEGANYTSIDAPPEIDEWAMTGLTPVAPHSWSGSGPPRVGESAFSLECELHDAIDVGEHGGEPSTTLVLGRVVTYAIREDTLNEDSTIDPGKLLPISRGGGITYFTTKTGMEIPRPVWEKEKEREEVKEAMKKAKD